MVITIKLKIVIYSWKLCELAADPFYPPLRHACS